MNCRSESCWRCFLTVFLGTDILFGYRRYQNQVGHQIYHIRRRPHLRVAE